VNNLHLSLYGHTRHAAHTATKPQVTGLTTDLSGALSARVVTKPIQLRPVMGPWIPTGHCRSRLQLCSVRPYLA